jgi:hypothetical protein
MTFQHVRSLRTFALGDNEAGLTKHVSVFISVIWLQLQENATTFQC